MAASIHVKGAPQTYLSEKGALAKLPQFLSARHASRVLVVTGVQSWSVTQSFWPELDELTCDVFVYRGEVTDDEVTRLVQAAKSFRADSVIGVGGGKVLDLVKAAREQLEISLYLIPTLPSTCAAWTPISVMYNEEGAFTRFDIHPHAADVVIVDPLLLIHAPLKYLIAGIGDTLAKWYEARVQIEGVLHRSFPLATSFFAAEQCRDVLFNEGEEAIRDAADLLVTPSYERVLDIIFAAGGMVGGYGDKYGRVAGAHAIHNGLTVLPQAHASLHGYKVAYGILVQLELEERPGDLEKVLEYYRKTGLPRTLTELGLPGLSERELRLVAQRSVVPGESIHLLPGEMTAERVIKAINEIEKRHVLISH